MARKSSVFPDAAGPGGLLETSRQLAAAPSPEITSEGEFQALGNQFLGFHNGMIPIYLGLSNSLSRMEYMMTTHFFLKTSVSYMKNPLYNKIIQVGKNAYNCYSCNLSILLGGMMSSSKNNPLNFLKILEGLYYFTVIASALIGVFIEHCRWAIIVSIIMIIILLLFLHIRNKDIFNIKNKIITGSLILITLFSIIILLFFPKPDAWIKSIYFPEPTWTSTPPIKKETVNCPVCPKITETPTPIPTDTNEPVPDEIITPSPTPILSERCLPAEFWTLWYKTEPLNTDDLTDDFSCLDLSDMGIVASDHKVRLFAKPQECEYIYGIITPISQNVATISIELEIETLTANQNNHNTEIYIGLIEGVPNELNGELISFRAHEKDHSPAILFGNFPGIKSVEKSSFALNEEIIVVIYKNTLSLDFSVYGAGEPILIKDKPFNTKWKYFFIGYKAPRGSEVSAFIKDIKIDTDTN